LCHKDLIKKYMENINKTWCELFIQGVREKVTPFIEFLVGITLKVQLKMYFFPKNFVF